MRWVLHALVESASRVWLVGVALGAMPFLGPAMATAAEANLALTFTHFPEPGVGLVQEIYTTKVANAGPATANSVKVVASLPPNAVFDNAGGINWDCAEPVARVLTCTLPSLAAGMNAPFLGIAVIPAPEGGTVTLTATVSAVEDDAVPADNTATESVVVTPAAPVSFYSVDPCRIVDTRGPITVTGGPALAANQARAFFVNDICGIPPDARALAANVTVVGSTDVGDLRVHSWGIAAPAASTINFGPGQVRANSAVLPLIQAGIEVLCDMPPGSNGTVHFILDVSGYFR